MEMRVARAPRVCGFRVGANGVPAGSDPRKLAVLAKWYINRTGRAPRTSLANNLGRHGGRQRERICRHFGRSIHQSGGKT